MFYKNRRSSGKRSGRVKRIHSLLKPGKWIVPGRRLIGPLTLIIGMGLLAAPGAFASVVLTVDRPTLAPCGSDTYRLTVTNDVTPADNLEEMVVTVDLGSADYVYRRDSTTIATPNDGDLSGKAANPDGKTGPILTWDFRDKRKSIIELELRSAESFSIVFTVDYACSALSGTSDATLNGELLGGGEILESSPGASVTIQSPISISVTPASQLVNIGDTATWAITLTNTGADPTSNITLTDLLGTRFIESSDDQSGVWDGGAGTWTWAIPGPIDPGGIWTANVTAVADATGTLTSQLSVDGECTDPSDGTTCVYTLAEALAITTVAPGGPKSSSMTIIDTSDTGTAGSDVAIGEFVDYRMVYSFPEGITREVTLAAELPAGMIYVPDSADLDRSSSAIEAVQHPGDINNGPPGTPIPVTLAAGNGEYRLDLGDVVSSGGASDYILTVQAEVANSVGNQDGVSLTSRSRLDFKTGAGADDQVTSPDVVTAVVEPNLTISRTIPAGPAAYCAGATVAWRLEVTNSGNANAYRMNWEDLLPDGLNQISNPQLFVAGEAIYLSGESIPLTAADLLVSTTANTNDTLSLPLFQITRGSTVTITYDSIVMNTLEFSQLIDTASRVAYTSLVDGGRDNSTGPGTVDDDDDNLLNNYEESATRSLTIGPFIDADGDGIIDCNDPYPDDPAGQDTATGVPVVLEPADTDVSVALTPVLTAGYEAGADSGVHGRTRWQIAFDDGFSALVLDRTAPSNATRLVVPDLLLSPNTIYYWRVRYFDDSLNAWGRYAGARFYTGNGTYTDVDGNGVPDSQEVKFSADINEDGIYDLTQESVICASSGYNIAFCIELDGTAGSVDGIKWQNPEQVPQPPNFGVAFNYGIVSFRIQTASPGEETVVLLSPNQGLADGYRWLQYDSVLGWTDYSRRIAPAEGRTGLALTVQDGGVGDADGTANGVIIHASGPGYAFEGASSSGCFVGGVFSQ